MSKQRKRFFNGQANSNATVISGNFQIPFDSKNEHKADNNESDEDEENDPYIWADFYEEMGTSVRSVQSRIPKEKKVYIKDDHDKVHVCTGKFPLTQVYWNVTVKVSKCWLRSAPIYAIRTDVKVQEQKLVMIFLTDCLKVIIKKNEQRRHSATACFEAFCRLTDRESTLSFTNLEETFKEYILQERLKGCCLKEMPSLYRQYVQENHATYITQIMHTCDLYTVVLYAARYPHLVKTLSILLPNTFIKFLHKLSLEENKDKLACEMAEERPWEYAFRDIIYALLNIQGTEATLASYINSGFLSKTPQTEKDAIYIYEVLKVDSKKDGHTYMSFSKLRRYYHFNKLQYQIIGEERWRNALDYLERNNVIKREAFNSEVNIFLRYNWQAEVDTVTGLERILLKHLKEPNKWIINYQSPDFESICSDPDQLKALQLITSCPITVLSGKGGCGKTTVVTTLLKHMYEQEEKYLIQASQTELEHQEKKEGGEKAKDENNHNLDFEWDDDNFYKFQFGNDDVNMQDSSKPSDVSCINPSSQSLTDTNILCLANIAVVPTNDIAEDIVTSKINMPSCSRDPHNLADNLHTSSDLSGRISTQSSQILNKDKESESNKPDISKEESLRKEAISDLIKIVNRAKNVDNPALKDYKKRILLTAPTGKAAKLLGHKTKLPSATLHSVVMSWRHRGTEWCYSDVEVLVIDECSLLSVRLFACVMNILLKGANLCKIVLLGDVRQLPSIEAGNFLLDVFNAFRSMDNGQFCLSVELTSNHRSESHLIVENAGKISIGGMPTFNDKQRFHLVELSDTADDNDRDEAIRNLLRHAEDLRSHTESQFISFRNAHCQAVNELCCQHYNQHSLKEPSAGGKKGCTHFCIGDKVCLGKNALVTNSRRLMLDKYIDHDIELQAMFRDERLKQIGSDNLQGSLNQVTLGSSQVLNLVESDDALFDQTINDMKETERRKKEMEVMRGKQGLKFPAEPQTSKKSSRETPAFFRDKEEKLCNGEIFFIMDEIDYCFSDTHNTEHIETEKYLVLSDRDPNYPRVVCVPLEELRKKCKMQHSWARTIHTFQGSESDSVVYVLGKAIPQNWQHVYTAVTRGKKSVYIIGSWRQLYLAVSKQACKRCTRLRHRLEEMIKEHKTSFLNSEVRKVNAPVNVDDMDSDDSWVDKVNTEQYVEGASKDEGSTDLKVSSSFKSEEGTQAFDYDSMNDLNDKTHQHRNILDAWNVFSSFEENEDINGTNEVLPCLGNTKTDFTSLSGPEALSNSQMNLSSENNISGTFMISSNKTDLSIPGSPKHAFKNNSKILLTPTRSSTLTTVYSTSCKEDSLLNKNSYESSPKVRRTENLVNTPLRDSFTESLSLGDGCDDFDEANPLNHRRKKIRKNLNP